MMCGTYFLDQMTVHTLQTLLRVITTQSNTIYVRELM